MKNLLYMTLLFWVVGCGYKPTSLYTKEVFGDRIYTQVAISLDDPENSVLIKDAVNEAVYSQFHATIAPNKESAESEFYLSIAKVNFVPIQYDRNGYVITYKTYVELRADYIDKSKKMHHLQTTGDYDFPIESNSVISDTKRFEAIKFASQKALEAMRSKIAIGAIP